MTLKMPVTLTAATFVSGERLSEQRSWTLTPQSLQRRTGGELKSCSNKLPLRLEGPAPAQGEAAIFDVDILDPCWVFPQADLSKVRAISAAVGQLPFNFQVGEDAKKIPLHPPQTADGELEVRIDGCKGEPIAVLPLAAAKDRVGVTELPQAAVTARTGTHDLCLYFTRRTIDPIWAIEWVQLVEP
jgi:hexosaminidase